MMHDSGLTRTELVWYPGVLNRREVIRAVGEAKPIAPFGEKFQYQNVMVSAAGEAVASAENSTWEQLMNKRILQPLGMKKTVLTLPAVMRSKDYALGYEYDEAAKTAKRLPFRSESAMSSIAPAGSVYSNASDMAQWLRFMLAGGIIGGTRLVSEKIKHSKRLTTSTSSIKA
ncbi:MAG: serine hydrolase domain-containing protein [Pyrinomonadaceae bacterium]